MARKSWSQLSDAYRRRLIRAGVSPFDTGESRQKARGHKAREHLSRELPAEAGGGFTFSSTDRAFLAKQRKRAGPRYEAAVELYRELTPGQREKLRARQQASERHYKSSVRRTRRGGGFAYASGKPAGYSNPYTPLGPDPKREEPPSFYDFPAGYSNPYTPLGPDPKREEPPSFYDFVDGYDEMEPDYDDDLEVLLYYH